MKDENNPIKLNLEDKFRLLIPEENAPEDLKKEVFNTLDMLNLLGDIADLFTAKFTQTEAVFLDIIQDSDNTENSNNTDLSST